MIRDNYIVKKSKITVGYTYGISGYELQIWFDNMDLDKIGVRDNIPLYPFKDMGICKRGYSFKKAQQFLDSEEGKQWLGNYLKERDYKKAKSDKEFDVRKLLWNMNYEELLEVEKMINDYTKGCL